MEWVRLGWYSCTEMCSLTHRCTQAMPAFACVVASLHIGAGTGKQRADGICMSSIVAALRCFMALTLLHALGTIARNFPFPRRAMAVQTGRQVGVR